MADALQVARARILRYLERRGVITLDSGADSNVLCVSEELAERWRSRPPQQSRASRRPGPSEP